MQCLIMLSDAATPIAKRLEVLEPVKFSEELLQRLFDGLLALAQAKLSQQTAMQAVVNVTFA